MDKVIVKCYDDNNDSNIVRDRDVIYIKKLSEIKTHLYILTYNFPEQLQALLESFEKADKNFLDKPIKFLLNNSTDRSTDEAYMKICEKYNFIEIKKNNIGICGGRQFIAEHFQDSDADYYIFFEDDMMLHEQIIHFVRVDSGNLFLICTIRHWKL